MSPEHKDGPGPEDFEGGPVDVTPMFLDKTDIYEFLDFVASQPNKQFALTLDFDAAKTHPNDVNYLATNPKQKKFVITIRATQKEFDTNPVVFHKNVKWEIVK